MVLDTAPEVSAYIRNFGDKGVSYCIWWRRLLENIGAQGIGGRGIRKLLPFPPNGAWSLVFELIEESKKCQS